MTSKSFINVKTRGLGLNAFQSCLYLNRWNIRHIVTVSELFIITRHSFDFVTRNARLFPRSKTNRFLEWGLTEHSRRETRLKREGSLTVTQWERQDIVDFFRGPERSAVLEQGLFFYFGLKNMVKTILIQKTFLLVLTKWSTLVLFGPVRLFIFGIGNFLSNIQA